MQPNLGRGSHKKTKNGKSHHLRYKVAQAGIRMRYYHIIEEMSGQKKMEERLELKRWRNPFGRPSNLFRSLQIKCYTDFVQAQDYESALDHTLLFTSLVHKREARHIRDHHVPWPASSTGKRKITSTGREKVKTLRVWWQWDILTKWISNL